MGEIEEGIETEKEGTAHPAYTSEFERKKFTQILTRICLVSGKKLTCSRT
jgi:hypothetical protein